MSPGGTIPSPLLCAGGALVPAAAAGDGPRARLDKPKNVALNGLRALEPQCVRALRAFRGPRVGLPLGSRVEGLEPLRDLVDLAAHGRAGVGLREARAGLARFTPRSDVAGGVGGGIAVTRETPSKPLKHYFAPTNFSAFAFRSPSRPTTNFGTAFFAQILAANSTFCVALSTSDGSS